MTKRQYEMLKEWLKTSYSNRPGEYFHIPEVLLSIVMRGSSLKLAKTILIEVVQEQGWSFTPTSFPILTVGVVDGRRGEDRILRWFILQDTWKSHFQVLKGAK